MRRRAFLRAGCAGTAVSLLGACGFRPVYMRTASGHYGTAQRELQAINVEVIADRPGQLLRQALQQRFDGSESGLQRRYDLSVDYQVPGMGIAVRQDNSVTRIRLVGLANYTLRGEDPNRTVITKGNARVMDDYNIIDQQFFAADLENEAAQRRVAEATADQIALQLAAFFKQRALAAE